jgi:thiamine-monophosphate kinase
MSRFCLPSGGQPMLSEFDLIRRFFSPRTTHTVLAGGDDAALISVAPGMELAISVDTLVAGRHFFTDAEPRALGHKCIAVNLSDMAAVGATPRWATLALTLPTSDEQWLERFASGFLSLAAEYDVDLIGGDTTSGPLTVSVQIMGEVPRGKALRRSCARKGDDLWVSGSLGDAALALAYARGEFQLDDADLEAARRRLNRPEPRVALGRALLDCATSAIDVSDGLVADVGHIAAASRVRAIIHWGAVPMSSAAMRAREHAKVRSAVLAGGDDYELAFTAPIDRRAKIAALTIEVGVSVTRIGTIEAGEGVVVVDDEGNPLTLAEAGFDHFR